MRALERSELVFGVGPAGTGKTYLAVAQAVAQLITGSVQRLILSRPAVEAGERLGFLPGDMKEKVDPYLRPLYDALNEMMDPELVPKLLWNSSPLPVASRSVRPSSGWTRSTAWPPVPQTRSERSESSWPDIGR